MQKQVDGRASHSIPPAKSVCCGAHSGIEAPNMAPSSASVTVVDHPLVQHKLTLMRDKERSTKSFRQLLKEIGMLLCYEITRDLPIVTTEIETPLQKMQAPIIAGKKLVFAPILRAGVGFLDGMLEMVPAARVAHIGLYRDPETLAAVEYYFKAPSDIADRMVIVMDPMLATGNSAIAAVDRLKQRGVKDLRFVCLLAAPEGIAKMQAAHPDVRIWTAAIDSHLNDHGYIVPGLGDAGDRMFGTK
jgi:uracil phosphoribosyltransferase